MNTIYLKYFQAFFCLCIFLVISTSKSNTINARQININDKIDDRINDRDYKAAIKLLEKALKEVDSKDTVHLRQYTADLGYVFFHLGKFQNSIAKYEEALNFTKAQSDHNRTSSFLRSIGLNYQYLGLYGLAIEGYQEALYYLGLSASNPSKEAALYNSMGNLYRKTQNEVKSLQLLHQSLQIYKNLGDTSDIADVMNNLGANYEHFNNLDSSLYYFQGVLNLVQLDINSPISAAQSRSVTFNNIGVILLNQGKLKEAFPYLKKAYQIHQITKDQQGLAISYNNLGDYWLKKGNVSLASSFLDSAFLVLQETKDKSLLLDNLNLRFQLLESSNQYKAALATYKTLDSLNNQLFQDEKLKVEEISNIYLLREKEFENQKISQEAELFALQSSKFQQTSLFLALLGIILTLFLFWVFRNLKRQKKLTQIIGAKNETISLQQTELRHRTANNIMRLQSIIKEIARRVPDNTAQQEMLRSTQLLHSAASLERYLFSIEDEEEVNLNEFLDGLVQQHREMLAKENRAIEIAYLQSAEIVLPVASVIPISMILTEWIYNSLKYAFKGIDEPKITIAIQLNNQNITIDYQDNGVGIKGHTSKGTGSRLIEKFALDLNAKITSIKHQGMRYELVFNYSGQNLLLK
ncbi:tetratricopeptide repeat protein [uncultured Cyclobacterium sp.]|uniref:tetratricopeptide repeat protein n=1 Tax=uncultured Cyclobacterium sp. TaxID=453820 RepID=UPI0030EDA325|tara:strand:- start:5302 stop:7212 length:1911 start_codon:yes stop_codon:yes gene_type:complete